MPIRADISIMAMVLSLIVLQAQRYICDWIKARDIYEDNKDVGLYGLLIMPIFTRSYYFEHYSFMSTMKRTLFAILGLSLLFGCKSEKAPVFNNLDFEGIPIVGDGVAFGKELENRGFELVQPSKDDGLPCYTGTFLLVEDSRIYPVVSEGGVLWRVGVRFPETTDRDFAITRYDRYRSHLSELYGTPIQIEDPDYSLHEDTDHSLFEATDHSLFESLWKLEKGTISLEFWSDEDDPFVQYLGTIDKAYGPVYWVLCLYDDAEGSAAFEKEESPVLDLPAIS